MRTFVGVDYHKAYSYGTIMTASGEILKQERFENSLQGLSEFLGPHHGAGCSAVLEASRTWPVMYDLLAEAVGQVTVAHPLKVKAIAAAKVKTDKIDARTLADLLRANLIPEAYVCSPSGRQRRAMIRYRFFLVRLRTMVKNRLHVWVDGKPGLREQCPTRDLFAARSLRWLEHLGDRYPDGAVLGGMLRVLGFLSEEVNQSNAWVREACRESEVAERLQTIPGIGPTIGLLLVAEIDQIDRFAAAKKLHAYAGLVPSTYASGGRSFHGRLNKASNGWIRWAMVEAVWPAIRADPSLRAFYQRRSRRKGANVAKVATARRLLTIVFKVWKEGRTYRHENTVERIRSRRASCAIS
jgi:transposase